MNKKTFVSATLSILSFGAMADSPSFDKFEIGAVDFDSGSEDIDGFELKFSAEINDNLYVAGDYTRLSESGNSFNLTTVDVG